MSRFHLHIAVDDLDRNIAFYTAVFGADPTVVKPDYAKWQLEDPRINFAISARGAKPGVDHVGLQSEDEAELAAIRARLEAAGVAGVAQENTSCCYARSDKYWVQDPQGIAWETFHSLGSIPLFSEEDAAGARQQDAACCPPAAAPAGNCCG
ncbi:ArsI/CadI family heavy metal resistance metalloenzyme [Acidihalobacter prosperus]|uniref:Glyoxalase n=1 Tax=Acidihalobacter prosperus TaxID=160660 RepID=A0A1A6C6A5_9GAMM|nr:ArsI/CadI family heavy metal resistance metalloenzyme [Acidihalobacter prosperus]OBS10096.1 glyoxalase [Acidihalobacter prosperus]